MQKNMMRLCRQGKQADCPKNKRKPSDPCQELQEMQKAHNVTVSVMNYNDPENSNDGKKEDCCAGKLQLTT